MIYPACPECGERYASHWNGVICRRCGHDVSEYDERVLPGSEARKEWRERQNEKQTNE